MKRIIYILVLLHATAFAQENVYPAKSAAQKLIITNGTIHVGNGQVIENGTVEIVNGKITRVEANVAVAQGDAKMIDAEGKHVYPGLILPVTDLGLREISGGVRGSNDYQELGDINASIRAIVAYNTDSKIINTLKANGILLAGVTPQGGTISGSSSVVQLDAWNWEDAAYKLDNGIHLNMPSFISRPTRFQLLTGIRQQTDPSRDALDKVDEIKSFFKQARAYLADPSNKETNLKFEAVQGLYDRSQKLFVHANQVKQMLIVVDFVKEFGFDVVIVGGGESWQIAGLLKQNNIAVILGDEHALPVAEDDDIDQPFKTPVILQKAGVLFALNDEHGESRYRNLPFNAGTAAAYGLTREEALQAITLNSAKILGVADKTGSIEVGKDANIVVSEGDILDMRTSNIQHAIIQGREVSLDNKQKQLYERYKYKYQLQ